LFNDLESPRHRLTATQTSLTELDGKWLGCKHCNLKDQYETIEIWETCKT